jgi:hypothetical protein
MSLANLISTVIGVCLTPAAAYIAWRLIDVVIEAVPPLRDWRDFRGLDRSALARTQRRLTASIHRVRELPRPTRAIVPTPIPTLPARQPLALPAGTSPTADQEAQVA